MNPRLYSKWVNIKKGVWHETKFLLIPLFESWRLLLFQPAARHCAIAKQMVKSMPYLRFFDFIFTEREAKRKQRKLHCFVC